MQTTSSNRAEAVAAWTAHYEADPVAARARLVDMHEHGVPDGRVAEKLGAALALTPRANRCDHYGDKTNCTQCLAEEIEAEDERKREARARKREIRGAYESGVRDGQGRHR